MKKSLLILIAIAFSVIANAQTTSHQKEVGLTFSNFDDFGITYKVGTQDAMWRFSVLSITGSSANSETELSIDSNKSIGGTLGVGKEFREIIANGFELRYGADIKVGYGGLSNDYDDKSFIDADRNTSSSIFRLGANLVLGANYILSDKIVFGVELLPGFNYFTGSNTNNDINTNISRFDYHLSNNSALISVAYRL